jgi:hypothetical protein
MKAEAHAPPAMRGEPKQTLKCHHAAPDPNSLTIAAICSFIFCTVRGCSLSGVDLTYNSNSLSAFLRATAAICKLRFLMRARASMKQS